MATQAQYLSSGRTITVFAPKDLKRNEVFRFRSMPLITAGSAQKNQPVAVYTDGVFLLPKLAGEDVFAGEMVNIDANGYVVGSEAPGIPAGYALRDAGKAETQAVILFRIGAVRARV